MSEKPAPNENIEAAGWCLESLAETGNLQRVPIINLPFRIGRVEGLELTLPFQSVSKRHAEIYLEGDKLRLRDLASTNGTFVNRQRVSGAPLREGDILHFAEFEFRVGRANDLVGLIGEMQGETGTLALGHMTLASEFLEGTRELSELITHASTGAVFQPIVSLEDGSVTAYEVLGRGMHHLLPDSPGELFRIAATMGMEADLSRLFRKRAVEMVIESNKDLPLVFMNTHPSELDEPGLVESLKDLRDIAPDLPLALEIHEGALAEPQVIAELNKHLKELNIKLAYDDFGTGQARLLELAEVPPDYLKFDMRFVQRIDQAVPSRRRLLSALVAVALDLKAQPVAEGIETDAEAEVCRAVGFTLAQGYLFSRPKKLGEL